MATALDAPEEDLNEHERRIVANVREHGWFRTNVSGDEEGSGFSYSTGIWLTTGQPELITFSLKSALAHDIFWDLYRRAADGATLPVGVPIDDVIDRWSVFLLPVAREQASEHLFSTGWFYGNYDFPCLQLVWPDPDGLFPWEQGFDPEFRDDQPDLSGSNWARLGGQGNASA